MQVGNAGSRAPNFSDLILMAAQQAAEKAAAATQRAAVTPALVQGVQGTDFTDRNTLIGKMTDPWIDASQRWGEGASNAFEGLGSLLDRLMSGEANPVDVAGQAVQGEADWWTNLIQHPISTVTSDPFQATMEALNIIGGAHGLANLPEAAANVASDAGMTARLAGSSLADRFPGMGARLADETGAFGSNIYGENGATFRGNDPALGMRDGGSFVEEMASKHLSELTPEELTAVADQLGLDAEQTAHLVSQSRTERPMLRGADPAEIAAGYADQAPVSGGWQNVDEGPISEFGLNIVDDRLDQLANATKPAPGLDPATADMGFSGANAPEWLKGKVVPPDKMVPAVVKDGVPVRYARADSLPGYGPMPGTGTEYGPPQLATQRVMPTGADGWRTPDLPAGGPPNAEIQRLMAQEPTGERANIPAPVDDYLTMAQRENIGNVEELPDGSRVWTLGEDTAPTPSAEGLLQRRTLTGEERAALPSNPPSKDNLYDIPENSVDNALETETTYGTGRMPLSDNPNFKPERIWGEPRNQGMRDGFADNVGEDVEYSRIDQLLKRSAGNYGAKNLGDILERRARAGQVTGLPDKTERLTYAYMEAQAQYNRAKGIVSERVKSFGPGSPEAIAARNTMMDAKRLMDKAESDLAYAQENSAVFAQEGANSPAKNAKYTRGAGRPVGSKSALDREAAAEPPPLTDQLKAKGIGDLVDNIGRGTAPEEPKPIITAEQQQKFLAASGNKRLPGESGKDYVARIKAQSQGKAAPTKAELTSTPPEVDLNKVWTGDPDKTPPGYIAYRDKYGNKGQVETSAAHELIDAGRRKAGVEDSRVINLRTHSYEGPITPGHEYRWENPRYMGGNYGVFLGTDRSGNLVFRLTRQPGLRVKYELLAPESINAGPYSGWTDRGLFTGKPNYKPGN